MRRADVRRGSSKDDVLRGGVGANCMYRDVYTCDAVPYVMVTTLPRFSPSQARSHRELSPTRACHCGPSQAVLHNPPGRDSSSKLPAGSSTGAW